MKEMISPICHVVNGCKSNKVSFKKFATVTKWSLDCKFKKEILNDPVMIFIAEVISEALKMKTIRYDILSCITQKNAFQITKKRCYNYDQLPNKNTYQIIKKIVLRQFEELKQAIGYENI